MSLPRKPRAAALSEAFVISQFLRVRPLGAAELEACPRVSHRGQQSLRPPRAWGGGVLPHSHSRAPVLGDASQGPQALVPWAFPWQPAARLASPRRAAESKSRKGTRSPGTVLEANSHHFPQLLFVDQHQWSKVHPRRRNTGLAPWAGAAGTPWSPHHSRLPAANPSSRLLLAPSSQTAPGTGRTLTCPWGG